MNVLVQPSSAATTATCSGSSTYICCYASGSNTVVPPNKLT